MARDTLLCHARESGHPAFFAKGWIAPVIGERSDAVLRTAMPGNDSGDRDAGS
jgi:hypothetical protein